MGLFDRLFRRKQNNIYYFTDYVETNPYIEGLSARDLYKTQSNLHAVVSFLGDSAAHLPLNVYRREDETRRVRDRDSVVAKVLRHPNSDQTTYEFINALVIEYLLYGEAIVMLLPDDSRSGYQLRIIPSEWVEKRTYENNFAPSALTIRAKNGAQAITVPASQFVVFKMYNPGSPGTYQSPIASLKQTLSEQIQAAKFREALWRNGGRMNSYITRSANVTPWTPQARDAWIESFRKGWAAGGEKSGSMPILEDGMDIKQFNFSAKEAQYAESIQLTREDVAAAYHVNPSLIWHTTTQTYASAKDNARALYADCLGPLLQMIQQRINSFLIPKLTADETIYVEFNLEEKLKGSFEERASIMQSATGAPWLTRNEVRAEYNLQPIDGGDELIVPLNVIEGGQASPQDSTPDSYANQYASAQPEVKEVSNKINFDAEPKAEDIEKIKTLLEKFYKRQERVITTKRNATENWFDADRWNSELAKDFYSTFIDITEAKGVKLAAELGSKYNVENTEKYIQKVAENQAKAINEETYKALQINENVAEVYEDRVNSAEDKAKELADVLIKFAIKEAIEQTIYNNI